MKRKSIPSSGYSTDPDQQWLNGTYVWAHAMKDLGHIKGKLTANDNLQVKDLLLDLSIIDEAHKNFEARINR